LFFLNHHPVLHLLQDAALQIRVTREDQRALLLHIITEDGSIKRHTDFCNTFHLPHNTPSQRLAQVGNITATGVARAVVEFTQATLPITVKVTTPADITHYFTFTAWHRKEAFLTKINVMTGKTAKKMQVQGMALAKNTLFSAWYQSDDLSNLGTEHTIASAASLRTPLLNATLPVELGFIPKWNTSIAEQGWKYLNRHKHTIRNLNTEPAVLFLHRLCHLRNGLIQRQQRS